MKLGHIIVASLIGILLQNPVSSFAEEKKDLFELVKRFSKIDGAYEINRGGVPLLGYVIERPSPANVKFMLCSNRFIDVEEKELKRSSATCPNSEDKGKGKPGVNPFVILNGTIVSEKVLANTSDKILVAKEHGVPIESFPEEIKKILQSVPSGERVGVGYEGLDGKRQFGVFTNQIRRPTE